MRLTWVVMSAVLAVPAVARADGADNLRAQGESLAKQGNYAEAIDAFKASDALRPRASNACYIALAYTRRQLWSQAEIFLDLCHRRATAADPLPDWVAPADDEIVKKLGSADVAAIDLRIKPASPDVVLTVSSFAPDEGFSPRTIHLPFGQHVVFARAPGFADAQVVIEVKDRKPQMIEIELRPTGAPAPSDKTVKFVSETDQRWDVLFDQKLECTTPCTLPLDPTRNVTMRTQGSSGGRFRTVKIGHLRPDKSVIVTATPASTGKLVLSGAFITFGGVMALTGGLVLLVGSYDTGLVFAGVGVGFAVGAYFLYRSGKPSGEVSAAPYVGANSVGVAGRF